MAVLVVSVIVYNIVLYTQRPTKTQRILSDSALIGAQLYQENNCTACHQLYGLGGYLGPDLTNAVSNGDNAHQRIKTFLNLGFKSMPKFDFTDEEINHIVQFLDEVDKTGYYPDCAEEVKSNGWVKIKTKNANEAK